MTNEKTVGSSTSPKVAEYQLRHHLMERAHHACEGSPKFPNCRAKEGEEHPDTGKDNTLLAILRLEPGTKDPAQMRVLCSRCFLSTDFSPRATQGWREQRAAAGNLEMFPIEPKS